MAATYIARKAVELDLVPGRSPISVAAAAIYMASQASAEKKTQKGKRKQMKISNAKVFLSGSYVYVGPIHCQ